MSHTATSLGAAFAEAYTSRDHERMTQLLHPEVDFRALTPNRFWEAGDPQTVIDEILERWIEPDEQVEELISVETGTVGDRERVGYRYRLTNAKGTFLVEQQAFLSERDGRIGSVRLLCSGSRPL